MSPIVYAVPVFLLCIGLELLLARRMGRQVYRLNDAITSIHIGVISETIRALVKLLTVVVYAAVVDRVAVLSWDLKSPAVWVLAFFMYDFFYYWAHRSGHEVNLLWASHVVHHSSEEFNLSTALRQSSTNQVFYWIFYLPLAIAGIPVSVFVGVALVSVVYQFWVHTRLVDKLGWMDRVFVTPSNHRCHHGRNDYCIDKNYGATLIVWDRLFGTYTQERDDEPVVYGTLSPLHSWNPVWGNFKNYFGIWRDARATQGLANKLMVVFAPPGWLPNDAKVIARAEREPYRLFETPSPRWQSRYGVLACAVMFFLLMHLLIAAPTLSVPMRAAYAVLIVLSAVGVGQIFEGKPWAIEIEAVRAFLVFAALCGGVWFSPVTPAGQMLGLVGLLGSAAMLALVYSERKRAAGTFQKVST